MANGDAFGFGLALLGVASRPQGDPRGLSATDTFAVDCSSPASDDGTDISAAWANEIAANLRALVRGNGTKADGTTKIAVEDHSDSMLVAAVQQLIQRRRTNYCIDSGAANAMVASITPAPAEMIDGFDVVVKAAHAPTGQTTFALNGETPRNVLRKGGANLAGGEWADGDLIALRRNGGVWRMAGLVSTDVISADTLHGLFNVRLLTTSGTYYPTAGAKRGLVFVTGGGGAGGNAVGGGGGSGSTAIAFFDATTIGGGGIPYVIGGYGVPNPGTGSIIWGGNGGDSWFGALAYAGGGGGGSSSDSSTTNGIGGAGGVASNGIFYIGGNAGTNGTGSNGQPGDGGAGAGSFWGGGGAGGHNTSTSGGADGYAGVIGGGGGGADGPNPNKGGGGGYGIIFVLEFA